MKHNILFFSILLSFLFVTDLTAQIEMKLMPDGVIIPRADHTAIVLMEDGQMVYDTITKSVWYFNNTIWKEVGSDNLGNHTATTTLDMDNNPIENVPTPVNDMDAVNKAYVDLDLDQDTLNEIQTLSASTEGDTLYLSKSNWLIVPGLSDANYIKDFDGNVYYEVVIGTQIWLKEHLRATHYNDGTTIPKIELASDWNDWWNSWDGDEYTDVYDGYSWYNNDSTTYNKFGALYTWGVVDSTINGGKNACPIGYHVPTTAEVQTLITFAGGNTAGLHLKYAPGEYWDFSQNFPFGGKGDNSSGFSATGAGYRADVDGSYSSNKQWNYIWSRNGGITKNVHAFRIRYDDWEVNEYTNKSGGEGYTIRCIKIE